MASIEIGPLSQYLDDEELSAITKAFEEADIDLDFDEEADLRLVEGDIDEDIFADFLDRLDAQGVGCDIYVPGDFEELIAAGGYTIGSAHALMLALDEMRDDLIAEEAEEAEEAAADDEDFEEFEEDEDEARFSGGATEAVHIQEGVLRHLWKTLYKGARSCARDSVCLFVER
jgi:hypothetical protein